MISFKYVAAVDVDLDLIIVVSKLLKSGFRSVGRYFQEELEYIT